ncbi:MAG: response regulator [candidate division Zixibacteria bacterium]|nr:response regulator [candidate division Zixibacteria bacterium]
MKNSISIMIVDDELMMRNLLEKILAREGYKVLSAEDGEAALEILTNTKVDIVISDIKMPGMDGFGLLGIIKQDYPQVGVIIMTTYGDTYTVKDALLLGADEYITKPFKSYEISLVVERAYWRILSASNQTAGEFR